MQESDLPSPNIGAKGFHLRRLMAQAISHLQVNAAAYGNGRHPDATLFSAFLDAAKTASDALLPTTATVSFSPSSKSYSLAAGANQAGPTLNVGGHTGAVTYSSATPAKATVNATTGAITPVATGTSVITATFAANGGYAAQTVTYTATVTA